MKDAKFYILFILIVGFMYTLQCKYEHLTLEEVNRHATKAIDRVDKVETEYKQLRTKLDSQEARMGAASTQAAQQQAFLNAPTG